MPNTTLTVKSVQEEVAAALGASQVSIELDAKDYEKCLKDAVRVYNRNRPRRGLAALAVSEEQKKYGPLPHPGLQGVTDVQFVTSLEEIPDPFVFGEDEMLIKGDIKGTVGGLEMQLAYVEMARRMYGSEPDWYGAWEGKGYYLYIDMKLRVLLCSYRFTWHVQPTDDPNVGLSLIDDGDTDWITRYTLAKAKQILARVRGKFHGIPNPDGGSDDNDYSELASEGKEEERDLEAEIQKRRRPLLPVIE